jgi:uncharacterized membrane protein
MIAPHVLAISCLLAQCSSSYGGAYTARSSAYAVSRYAAPSYVAPSYTASYDAFSYIPHLATVVGEQLRAEAAAEQRAKQQADLLASVQGLTQEVASLRRSRARPVRRTRAYAQDIVLEADEQADVVPQAAPPPATPFSSPQAPSPQAQQFAPPPPPPRKAPPPQEDTPPPPRKAPPPPTPLKAPPLPAPQEPQAQATDDADDDDDATGETVTRTAARTGNPAARSVLWARCAACHGGDDPKGHFRIFSAANQLLALDADDRARIGRKVLEGAMPPPDSGRAAMTLAEYRVLAAWAEEGREGRNLVAK